MKKFYHCNSRDDGVRKVDSFIPFIAVIDSKGHLYGYK